MARNAENEDDLFRQAVAAFETGDLARALDLFRRIILLRGPRQAEAERYVTKIAERRRPVTRGGPTRSPEVLGVQDKDVPPPGTTDPGRPPFGVEPGAAAADASRELRRTPHMDVEPTPPVKPGAWLKVSVYTDTGPLRAGEEGEDVVLKGSQDRYVVDVWLVVAEPFEISGPATKRLILLRDEAASQPVQFLVQRKESAESAPESVLFSAFFAYQGRACGRVSRAVPLSAAPTEAAPGPAGEPLPEPGIEIDGDARPPDLTVRIVRDESDERLFQCFVQTPFLPEYVTGKAEPWRLSSLAADFVKAKMSGFTAKNATLFGRTTALRGAGIQFFEASPKLFQKVFWELIDGKVPLRTLSIVTEEPSIPWELMVPVREGDDEDREPLGVTYLISRWTARNHVLPPQKVPLSDAFVVAPRDSRPPLASAEEEVAMVAEQFPGQRIDPAGLQTLDEALGRQGRTLLHFICHGKSGAAGGQTLLLEKQEELDAGVLRAMPGVKKAFRTGRPLVFLNACEVGRQEPALIGAGGFAEAFMALGASGVIAPLWSVRDSIAHQVAEAFYQRIKEEPKTPFAQILRELRQRSYAAGGGEDTWAAYCFYGDPLAARGEA